MSKMYIPSDSESDEARSVEMEQGEIAEETTQVYELM